MENAPHLSNWAEHIFDEKIDFEALAKDLWAYQRLHNPVMRRYCELLGEDKQSFIPISFFKEFEMKCGADWTAAAIFESSGTTGQVPSRHFVKELELYKESALKGFFRFFPEQQYRILALLPSYLERGNSSLVQMVKMWMDHFGLAGSGFYLHNFDELEKAIQEGAEAGEPLLLIGVSFALLDFAAQIGAPLPSDSIVIETGGMKGRKEEMIRTELHARLQAGLGVENIGSEYGMTELLSQFYARREGRFQAPPWAKVVISDIHLSELEVATGVSGRINIIDLANLHSCGFIATDDIGRKFADGSFEVLGRLDHSEMRGCSLLY